MRQFILSGNVATLTSGAVTSKTDSDAGKVGVGYYPNGVATFDTGQNIKDKGFLALIRTADKGGPVILPIHTNHFSYVKAEYIATTNKQVAVAIPNPGDTDTDFTIIFVKKGVKFNERNKWTYNVHLTNETTGAQVATKLKSLIDANLPAEDISVSLVSATLTFSWSNDFEIIAADDLYGKSGVVVTSQAWTPGQLDAKYVADLAAKSAADAGFEYTYQDDVRYLYPDYPFNPLKAADSADGGFTVFTLRFAEPRDVKTVDTVIHQIIQVAFPTGADGITTFENACKYLAGETVESQTEETEGH